MVFTNNHKKIKKSEDQITLMLNIEESEDLKTWQKTGEKMIKTL